MPEPRRTIQFRFEGVLYEVGPRAAYDPYIILPDGRALKADGWYETSPPQPCGFKVVPHLFAALSAAEIAEQLRGALARRCEE